MSRRNPSSRSASSPKVEEKFFTSDDNPQCVLCRTLYAVGDFNINGDNRERPKVGTIP